MSIVRSKIACLGAGRMGRGIAVAFGYAGHPVTMIDVKGGRSVKQFARLEAEALDEIRKTLDTLTRIGMLKATEASIVMSRISVVPASADAEALVSASIVFEGVPEIVELKREVLGKASKMVSPDTVLASTTS